MYPGYEPDEVTPLPEPLQAKEILLTVINAQQDLSKKVTVYKLDQIKQSDIPYKHVQQNVMYKAEPGRMW